MLRPQTWSNEWAAVCCAATVTRTGQKGHSTPIAPQDAEPAPHAASQHRDRQDADNPNEISGIALAIALRHGGIHNCSDRTWTSVGVAAHKLSTQRFCAGRKTCCCDTTARLAQSAERKALNLVVVGSSPTVGVFGTIGMCAVWWRGERVRSVEERTHREQTAQRQEQPRRRRPAHARRRRSSWRARAQARRAFWARIGSNTRGFIPSRLCGGPTPVPSFARALQPPPNAATITTLPSRRARLPRARPPMESPTALASSFLVVHALYIPRPLTHPSPSRSRPYHVLSSAIFFTVLFSFLPITVSSFPPVLPPFSRHPC